MARSKNPDYHVVISNQSAGVEVRADLPEQFGLGLSSSYEAYSTSLSSTFGLGSMIRGEALAGGSIGLKMLTKQIWKDTQPIEFSISLIFDAETNAREDVHLKMMSLAKLALPIDGGGGILLPPNPWRSASEGGLGGKGNRTAIAIGRQWFFDNVIITGANITSETKLNKGFPIAGQIDLTIRTDNTYSRQDFEAAGSFG